jgi:PIN domain nuclease of toxin-antitoxin system
MNALLDTHAFLWWITDTPELSPRAREVISDGHNQLFLSAAFVLVLSSLKPVCHIPPSCL